MALRFATHKPAAARKYDFSVTYGTSELVPGHVFTTIQRFSAACKAVPDTSSPRRAFFRSL